MQEVKLEALRSSIKVLEARRKPDIINVEVLKGKYVIRNIVRKYKEFGKIGGEILSIGIQEDIMEGAEPIFVKQAVQYNVDNNITERIITTPGSKELSYASTTTYRFLDEKYMDQTAKIIFDEHVVELFYQSPMHAIVIHSKIYAQTARNQFEFFWERAKSRST